MTNTNDIQTLPGIEIQQNFQRDEKGLRKGKTYKFNEDGSVNWREMIDPKYIVFNLQNKDKIEKKYGKKISELTISEVDDSCLLIKLDGIKDLAKLRGYKKVIPNVQIGNRSVVCQTTILWRGNFETEMEEEAFGDGADATPENTTGFGTYYLTTIAINRAFVRAVRNYLEVKIVGFDEINPNGETPEQSVNDDKGVAGNTDFSTVKILENLAKDLKLSFPDVKKAVLEKHRTKMESDPETWSGYATIPTQDAYNLIDLLGKAKEKAKEDKPKK